MKYRVVGWTWYDNPDLPYTENVTWAERNAIIDDIKKHEYLFSGREHQEDFAPVLNDGVMRCFSQRAWGGIMAEAYGETGEYDYCGYTYGVNEKYRKTPDDVDDTYFCQEDFIPEENLNEEFKLEVSQEIFNEAITSICVALDDLDCLRYIDTGDTLTLTCGTKSEKYLVQDIDRIIKSKSKKLPYPINTPCVLWVFIKKS